jgi:hypothetical protein
MYQISETAKISEIAKILFENGLIAKTSLRGQNKFKLIFIQKIIFLGENLFIYVFTNGEIRFIFKNIEYKFKSCFSEISIDSFRIFVDESSGYILLSRNKTSYFFQFDSEKFINGGSFSVDEELYFGTIMRFDSNIVFVYVSDSFPVEIYMFQLNGSSSDRIILRDDGEIKSVLQKEGFILISTSLNGETIEREIRYTHYEHYVYEESVDEEPEDEESEDEESEDEEPVDEESEDEEPVDEEPVDEESVDLYKFVFNSLNKGSYKALKNQNLIDYENDVCAISLTKFKNNSKVVALQCRHAFMITSLKSWVVEYNNFTCPTCRRVILS